MTGSEFFAIWLLTSGPAFYLSMAVVLGTWRKDFDEYDGVPWLLCLISLLPFAGLVFGCMFACMVGLNRAIDLDWPLRIARDGRRKVGSIPGVVMMPGGTGANGGTYANVYVTPQPLILPKPASDPRMAPDPDLPTTLGYRTWLFGPVDGLLHSPHQGTPWKEGELHCEEWDEGEVIRGVSGIHAHLVPLDWRRAPTEFGSFVGHDPTFGIHLSRYDHVIAITGIVERLGRFVLGTEGWRAEWVIIKALHAPNRAIAAALAVNYPDAEITWSNQNEHW